MGHRLAKMQVYAIVFVPLGRRQGEILRFAVIEQFGQVHPIVGRTAFLGENMNVPGAVLVHQGLDQMVADHAVAHHHQGAGTLVLCCVSVGVSHSLASLCDVGRRVDRLRCLNG